MNRYLVRAVRNLVIAACAGSLAGCAARPPALPSQGGAQWVEVKSVHFTLWTDASAERGRFLVSELERRRQVLTSAMGGAARNMTSFVIALRDTRELGMYQPWGVYGATWAPWFKQNPTGQPGIVMHASRRETQEVLGHELAQVIMYGAFGRQPIWLTEAIATYFETSTVEAGDRSARIGLPTGDRIAMLRRQLPLTVAQLFACREHRCMDSLYYGTSWALLSYLLNEHYDGLVRYFQLSNQLPPEAELDAWRQAFPELPLDRIDDELASWMKNGQFRLPRISFSLRDFPVTERALGDADVFAARSFLRMMFIARDEEVGQEVRAALSLDPTNLLARLIQTELTHAIAADDARATAAAHPDDWRAWWLVELAQGGRAEVAQAHRRLCELAENSAPHCQHADQETHR